MDNRLPYMKYNVSGQGVTFHCPGCGAALYFDPVSGKMLCESCGNMYSTGELGDENRFTVDEEDTMECNVYKCRSCGAELNVTDNTCSTFCAYCGQPTVVFDRVATMKKPQFIIPFSVTKQQAVGLLRSKINDSNCVPKEVKEFSIDRVVGIYVPFWLFDIDYFDRQLLNFGNNRYYYRKGSTHFRNMTLDASSQLNSESSRRLEPYMTEALVPFKADYLSGFYSDRYDVEIYELFRAVATRAAVLFNREVEADIGLKDSPKRVKRDPKGYITDIKYALLPAWFLTFRYKDVPYTMLVNGQTGKVVGGLPYEKTPQIIKFILIFASVTLLAAVVYDYLWNTWGGDLVNYALGFAFSGTTLLLGKAVNNLRDIRTSNKLSSEEGIDNYSKNR